MEDIVESKQGGDKPEENVEEDEVDEDKTVLTVDAKMGSNEVEIRNKIHEIAKPYIDDEELDIDSPEVMNDIEKKLAKAIQDMMLKDFGKYWSVIVGKRFALGVGLRDVDKFGNFKIGIFNVLVFQCNQTEAK